MIVQWDRRKARTNLKKHGVSFEEARGLLDSDADCLEMYDEEHSMGEERFISVGPTREGILVVVWTQREDDVVRIISARRATAAEVASFRRAMRGC